MCITHTYQTNRMFPNNACPFNNYYYNINYKKNIYTTAPTTIQTTFPRNRTQRTPWQCCHPASASWRRHVAVVCFAPTVTEVVARAAKMTRTNTIAARWRIRTIRNRLRNRCRCTNSGKTISLKQKQQARQTQLRISTLKLLPDVQVVTKTN